MVGSARNNIVYAMPKKHQDFMRKKLSSSDEGSTSTDRLAKIIDSLRKTSFENFYPASVWRLKILFIIFSMLLISLIIVRLIISMSMNDNLKVYPIMMMHHSYRLHTIYATGKLIRQLILVNQEKTEKKSFFNKDLRIKLHQQILGDGWRSPKVAKDYSHLDSYIQIIVTRLQKSVAQLGVSQKYISDHIGTIGIENAMIVNPPSAEIHFRASAENKTGNPTVYYMPTIEAVLTFANEMLAMIDSNDKLNLVNDKDFTAYFLMKNTFDNFINIFLNTRPAIAADASRAINVQNNISFILLMVLISILGILLLILIPFIKLVNNELNSTLMMLLKISKQQISDQMRKIDEFLIKIKGLEANFFSRKKTFF